MAVSIYERTTGAVSACPDRNNLAERLNGTNRRKNGTTGALGKYSAAAPGALRSKRRSDQNRDMREATPVSKEMGINLAQPKSLGGIKIAQGPCTQPLKVKYRDRRVTWAISAIEGPPMPKRETNRAGKIQTDLAINNPSSIKDGRKDRATRQSPRRKQRKR